MGSLSPETCYPKPNKGLASLCGRSGFTLVELLVTVMILAVISSIAYLTFNQALIRTRDNQRKSDLRSITAALEIYYQKNGHFPYSGGAGEWVLSSNTNPWIKDANALPAALDTMYIDRMPKDPKQDAGNPVTSGSNITGYAYLTPQLAGGCLLPLGQYYVLVAGLENNNDADADKNKNYQYRKWI